ncbi:TniB family NTP-binding protein [Marinicella sp. S1101]|uniref:TniB family NTP-binding protein n=1 Tax=Marinicella marina TaxID=2996016 RepID=UPI002260A64B|nr:TniB family NTP-binding protein [Marinicella marina]MCX7553081.1 TniB family NTP-binding protein [Marinicella marina]
MNEYEHVNPKFHHILGLSKTERKDFLYQDRWIGYKQAEKVLTILSDLIRRPARNRISNLLFIAEPNNGKSTIVKKFVDTYEPDFVEDDCKHQRPVILAESPPKADEKELYIAILEQFMTPYRASSTKIKLRYQMYHLFRKLKVRMLILDEIHSLMAGTPVKQREVMNVIKAMSNELKIPIVGVGTVDALTVVHYDEQHASRFEAIKLKRWELNEDFQELVASFERVLPLKKPSDLSDPDSAELLFTISNGNIGNLHQLLIKCASYAIDNDVECINLEIIKKHGWVKPTQQSTFQEID